MYVFPPLYARDCTSARPYDQTKTIKPFAEGTTIPTNASDAATVEGLSKEVSVAPMLH